jgi:3-oxoacyl-[acyl-carrier-protein] synthase-3
MAQFLRSVIRGVGHFLPPQVVANDDLSKVMDTNDTWIFERTGIRERRFVEKGVPASELGLAAAKIALEKSGYTPQDMDLIIAATLSPDMYFPGMGTILQHKLGMHQTPALDIRAQCSGFVFSLNTAHAYLKSGLAKRILIVCAEVQSQLLDLTTRGREMAVLFGDGAGALVVESVECASEAELPSASNQVSGLIDSVMGGDGSGAEMLCLKSPGTATPGFIKPSDLEAGSQYPHMDGRAVFKQAVTHMLECAENLLKRNKLTASDIHLMIPHQANMRISESVRERLGLPKERVFNNIHKYGNTTAATIPICLAEAEQEGRIKRGDLVMTVAFGAGFTWGGNLFRW